MWLSWLFARRRVLEFFVKNPLTAPAEGEKGRVFERLPGLGFFGRVGATKKQLLSILIVLSICWLGSRWFQSQYAVPILMYHQVENVPRPGADTVSPKVFEWQMRYLREHGYTVIPLEQLLSLIADRKPLPRKTVVLTFDDGYENVFINACPIIKSYGYPMTMFVSAGRTQMNGYLNWGQMLAMQKAGVVFGSHGMNHAYLPEVSDEVRRFEIFESKKLLEQHLGRPVDIYCYAVSGFNKDIKAMVKAAGYRAALTTNRGTDRSNQDLYEIRRIRLSDKDRLSFFMWIKLTGYYNFLRKPKDPEGKCRPRQRGSLLNSGKGQDND